MKRMTHYLLGLVMACTAVCMVTLTSAAPAQAADCSVGWTQGGNQPVNNVFLNNGTPLKTGPYSACATISTYPTWSDALFHCQYYNANGAWWTHLRLTNWNQNGWANSSDVRALPVTIYFC